MRKILMITSTWNILYIDSLIQGILERGYPLTYI